MAKERARRRAEREAAAEVARARRSREVARRARRRSVVRALTPRVRRRGRTGRILPRRSPGQRAGIVILTLLAIGGIWYLVPDPTLRLLLTVVLLFALPVFVVLALGRRT
jgi:hypothetical protein